jgi:thiamine-phosphate pyrophosphorylase
MKPRQSLPEQWLIADSSLGEELWTAIPTLPRGSGVLVLRQLSAQETRRLRHLAVQRHLTIAFESRMGTRVHNSRELRRALLKRTPLILLSPLYPTLSHRDWKPLPRMRAATLAGLGRRRLFALGGMNARKFARIKALGFQGWAGISAFRI